MSRIAYALSGRDTCSGQCETRLGCDCLTARRAEPAPAPLPRFIPTRRGWFDRWVIGARAAYLRKLIANGEARQEELRRQIRDNATDLAQLRVELALVES